MDCLSIDFYGFDELDFRGELKMPYHFRSLLFGENSNRNEMMGYFIASISNEFTDNCNINDYCSIIHIGMDPQHIQCCRIS